MQLIDKINPKHTALLVIDIQKDFVDPEGFLAQGGRDMSMINAMMSKLPGFIESAKTHGVLTLYTQQIYDPRKLNPLQQEQYELDNNFITCDIKTDGWHLYNISPDQDDIYQKYNYNAFSNPKLIERLEQSNIKSLIIVGVDTIYCIETAIRNGFDLGYKMVVPEDLVAGNAKHKNLHDKTLALVNKTYGVVTTSTQLANLWATNENH